ncbi:MAG: putative metal-dependent hydrolase [Terriglobia bacterium]
MADLRYPIGPLESYAPHADVAELLAEMAETPHGLRTAVDGLSPMNLDTPYREGGWTVRQIAHHLTDSQVNWYVRTKLALTEDEPTIRPYDADRWSECVDARSGEVESSLLLLDGLYRRWIPLLKAVTPTQWTRRLYHPERGWLTLRDTLRMHAWHGRHHPAQIAQLRKRMGWT